MGSKEGRRRAGGGEGVGTAVAPGPTVWLIACTAPGNPPQGAPRYQEPLWTRYAARSDRRLIWRMNNHRYNHPQTRQHDRDTANLQTLAATVQSMRSEIPDGAQDLVIMCHGVTIRGIREYFGLLRTDGTGLMLDEQAMRSDANWNDRVLPFDWPQRGRYTHYIAFASNMRALPHIRRVHLYGCVLGRHFGREGLMDFARDIGREVYAYQGYLAVEQERRGRRVTEPHYLMITELQTQNPAEGVREISPGNFRAVSLRSIRGLLPGWQVRVRLIGSGTGATEEYDEYNSVMSRIEHYPRGSAQPRVGRNVIPA